MRVLDFTHSVRRFLPSSKNKCPAPTSWVPFFRVMLNPGLRFAYPGLQSKTPFGCLLLIEKNLWIKECLSAPDNLSI